MAYSACPKCGKHNFELIENTPAFSNYRLMFIQCARCGTVVGATEYLNIGNLIKQQEDVLTSQSEMLSEIIRKLNDLINLLQK